MNQTFRMLRVVALVLSLGVVAALATTASADDETPTPPGLESWPGKVACGGEINRGDDYCYIVPDINCHTVGGVIEDCVERKPEKPGEKPAEPEAPTPIG